MYKRQIQKCYILHGTLAPCVRIHCNLQAIRAWPIQKCCILHGTLVALSLKPCELHAIHSLLCTAGGGGPPVGKLYFLTPSRPKTIAIYIRSVLGRFKSAAIYRGPWRPVFESIAIYIRSVLGRFKSVAIYRGPWRPVFESIAIYKRSALGRIKSVAFYTGPWSPFL